MVPISNIHDEKNIVNLLLFQKYPERFYFEGLTDVNTQTQHQYLPVYFGNVCLRFIPVSVMLTLY